MHGIGCGGLSPRFLPFRFPAGDTAFNDMSIWMASEDGLYFKGGERGMSKCTSASFICDDSEFLLECGMYKWGTGMD